MSEVAAEFLEAYKLRNPRSTTLAEYAVGHVTRLVGWVMMVDVSDQTVKDYQTSRMIVPFVPISVRHF